MSFYARNHLQDDWDSPARDALGCRVQAAEREAAWYFDRATAAEKAEHDAQMRALLGVTGPRADRARADARARFRTATAAARALLEATIDCLLSTGEVSAELDARWTVLIDGDAAREAAE